MTTNVVETESTRAVVTDNPITNIVEVTSAGPAGPPGGSLTIQDNGVDEGILTGKINFAGSTVSVNNDTINEIATVSVNAATPGANTNITSMGGITGGISTPDFIQFDTAAAATGAVGKLLWNDTDGTLEFQMKGGNVTLQIGQEEVIRVTNQSGSAMVDGQAVYITGSTGNHLNVTLAQANSEATSSKTIAVVTEPIANNQSGFATSSGLVRNLNTSALTEGAAVWLSPTVPGGLTSTKPVAPDHAVLVGWCVKQHASVGVLYVHIANGYELQELHNVLITSVQDKQVIRYDSATSLWKNVTLSPSLTLSGDASGSATFTDLSSATLSVTVADNSHNHTIANVTDLQTSLDAKAPLASPTFTGTVTLPSTTDIGTVSSTEIGYLDGVTSAIQTQINSKANLAGDTFTGPTVVSVSSASDAFRVTQTGAGNSILVEDNVNPDSSPFVVTGTGNVGVGLTAPTYKLHVTAVSTSTIAAFEGSTGTNKPGLYLSTDESLNTTTLVGNSLAGSNSLIIGSGGASLRFHTSSGRISTSSTTTDVPAKFTVNNGTLASEMNFSGGYAEIAGYRSQGTNASKTAVTSGSDLIRFSSYGYDGTNYISGAYILFEVDGSVSTNNVPTGIRFHAGAISPSEVMRITSGGNVGIGALGPTSKLTVDGTIESLTGGFKFPDGTTQTTAATGSGTSFTAGSVVFAGASGVLSEDNANFFWDDTNNRLGIGTASPAYPLDINGSARIGGALRGTSGSVASAATITPTSDATNQYNVTALATGATLAPPSGTPVDGQKLTLRIKDNGTAQTLTWTTGSSGAYRAVGATLPSTTVAGKTLYVGCIYNSADARWDVVATSQEA